MSRIIKRLKIKGFYVLKKLIGFGIFKGETAKAKIIVKFKINKNSIIKNEVVMKRLMNPALALLIALLFAGGEAIAQTGSANDFTNNSGGSYKATENLGKIVMKAQGGNATQGVFRSDDGNGLGRDATNRIQGTVEWRRDGGAQVVQGNNAAGPGIVYYTHLTYTGTSTKSVEDNVWVFGTYNPNPSGTTGDRTYNGTFHYDGDGSLSNGVGAGFKATYQIIYGENAASGATNRYNNLDIVNGPKINNSEVNCMGYITNSDGDNILLTVSNNFIIGTGASIITGDMTISPDSNLVAAPASAYFRTTGAGTMNYGHAAQNTTLAASPKGLLDLMSTGEFTVEQRGTLLLREDPTSPGSLNVGYNATTPANAILNFDGIFTNSHSTANTALRTNMTFAAASTVRYRQAAGTPEVAGNNPSEFPAASGENNYKYGNLELSGGVDKGVDGSVYMRGNFSLAGANFIISTDNTLADATIFDRDVTGGKTATYDVSANAGRYVQGKMRITGTIPTASAITMNNALTQVTFDATAGAPSNYFQLDVFPGTESNYLNIKADKGTPNTWREKNLLRHVRMNYATAAGTPKISRLQVGFDPTGDRDGSWNGDATKIRFFEGYNSTEEQQKLLMMGHPATTNADNVILADSLVDLIAAGSAPGTPYQLSDGSDIILGAPPVLYITVQDGRWSNPVTWDEGMVPPYFADAEVRHLVYTGSDLLTFGMTYNTQDERDGSGAIPSPDINAAAKSITIVQRDVALSRPHPALVIAHEPGSLGAGHIFRTQLSAPAPGEIFGIFNENDGTGTTEYGPNLLRSVTGADLDKIQGIYVMRAEGAGPVPVLGAGQILNSGRIYNEGIIEVGR